MLMEINNTNDRMDSPFESKLPWMVPDRGQPASVKPQFCGTNADFDFVVWSNEIAKISESVQREIMKLKELLANLTDYTPAEHRGLMGEEGPGRHAFDRLEEEVDEVLAGLEEKNDITHSEYALAANQPDAYSEFIDSDFDWRIEDGPFPYILDMAA
ncbi:hypothetical protein [Pseudomonas sp. MWU12-2037]|uniref:hypothetical protein n=1 Tax=Pseudomonas sp. MWU12-2037 TaxID=2928690 RepID=UPI00200CDB2D|nr:hypothetical protein [Pseudomonas sp. MWU12-2037]